MARNEAKSDSCSRSVDFLKLNLSQVMNMPSVPHQFHVAPLVSFDQNGDIPSPRSNIVACKILYSIDQQSISSNIGCHARIWKRSQKKLSQVFMQFLCSQLGLFVLVSVYIMLGGIIFYGIESKYELRKNEQIKIKHWRGIHNIRHIATDEFNWMLNVSFELRYALWRGMLSRLDGFDDVGWRVQVHSERFDKLIDDELARMQAEEEKLTDKHDKRTDAAFNQKWTFPTAMLYSATVITTVGYGNITPKSILGKLATCIYAVIGIPLMIMYLTNTGDLLAFFFVKYYSITSGLIRHTFKSRQPTRQRTPAQLHRQLQPSKSSSTVRAENKYGEHHVPVPATIAVLAVYIVAGAVLFSHWEGWSYIDGAYFSFITFTTIGLGDIVPGKGTLTENKNGKSILCAFYLLYGLVLTTMCFKLVQNDLFALKRRLFLRLGFDNHHHIYNPGHIYVNRRYGLNRRKNKA